MLLKTCPKCKRLITINQSHCQQCMPQVIKERDEQQRIRYNQYNKGRGKGKGQGSNFYNRKEWKALATRYRESKSYKCELCGAIASEVHHKIPISVDWSKRLEQINLMLLCKRCHNKQHNR